MLKTVILLIFHSIRKRLGESFDSIRLFQKDRTFSVRFYRFHLDF